MHLVVALRDPATGHVDNTTDFNPYGAVRATTGSLTPTAGYQGDYTDPTTDEVWMGARHYNPGTATFTSRDTYAGRLEQPVSLNRYTYAHNNPLTLWDPDGHAPTGQDYANLEWLMSTVNPWSFDEPLGYMQAVNSVVEAYRLWEYSKLVGFFGVAGAKWLAPMHARNVVDPVIANSIARAADRWRAKEVQSSVSISPSGVLIGYKPGKLKVRHDEWDGKNHWTEAELRAAGDFGCVTTFGLDDPDCQNQPTEFLKKYGRKPDWLIKQCGLLSIFRGCNRVLVEVKSGDYSGDSYCQFNCTQADRNAVAALNQMNKDLAIRVDGLVDKIEWHFYYGVTSILTGETAPLVQELLRHGVDVVIHQCAPLSMPFKALGWGCVPRSDDTGSRLFA